MIAKHFLKPDELTVAPAREYGALQRLAPYDIAPQPIFYDPAIGPIVLYEFLPGIMWDRQCPSATQLDRLARLWLALHALPTADLWPSRGWEKRPEELFATFQHGFDAYDDWAAVHFPKGQTALVLCREALER
ncbi:MAG: hypothetical protein KDE31_34325, partial [Caldilineaceae bacterium]|nr:hypothetical protein [Caldilineaceae bacterium]